MEVKKFEKNLSESHHGNGGGGSGEGRGHLDRESLHVVVVIIIICKWSPIVGARFSGSPLPGLVGHSISVGIPLSELDISGRFDLIEGARETVFKLFKVVDGEGLETEIKVLFASIGINYLSSL